MGEAKTNAGLVADDAQPSSALFELVYAELKRMAHKRLRHQHEGGAELDTTSLVHECFLRMHARAELDVSDRPAFLGYVGRVMRSIVIDQVRARQALKRGGGERMVTLTTGVEGEVFDDEQLLALNAALEVLERLAPDFHRLVELRYFAGLSVDAVAELNGTSTRTVEREWVKARTFLRQLIDEADREFAGQAKR
jgi:RNA polymerase sigma factor (TIGR02999 family)